ncbi:gag-pol polyprotein [Tanacetum coccineum]
MKQTALLKEGTELLLRLLEDAFASKLHIILGRSSSKSMVITRIRSPNHHIGIMEGTAASFLKDKKAQIMTNLTVPQDKNVVPTAEKQIHHPLEQVRGKSNHASFQNKTTASTDPEMEELHQFDRLKVWELVDKQLARLIIKLRLWRTRGMMIQTVIRNKARLVANGYAKQEGRILKNHLHSARLEARFGIFEEVYVAQPEGFVDPDHPKKVYLLRKALYGLKQAPRAWYDELSNFLMSKGFTKAFSDADHAGCIDTRKSTSGGIQFLGDKLVSWMSKKQNCTAMSLAEAEYVSLSASCAKVMWMRTRLKDYGFNYNKIPLYCDSQSTIAISCNPVQHSQTKHIHTRYHFIKQQVENGIIELYFFRTEYQLADMFTKALPEDRFKYLVRRIGMKCLTPPDLEVLTNETT